MTMTLKRRDLLKILGASSISTLVSKVSVADTQPQSFYFGESEIIVVSDGNLSLSASALFDNDAQSAEAKDLFENSGIEWGVLEPPLNITALRNSDQLVLFDVGSGSQFFDTAGLLPLQLEAAGIDPLEVTDVVFTHAHPDHCWGLLDDFDELLCPNATFHMHGVEYDYWMSEKTIANTPEAGLGMVAGARNRLPLIEAQLKRFNWGEEILPGIEAVDTHGHTAGHTSFAIHQSNESLMVLGDALIHPVLSFQRPNWSWPSDQDAHAASASRLRLLDRMQTEKSRFIGYHLPIPGYGSVDKLGDAYQFVAQGL